MTPASADALLDAMLAAALGVARPSPAHFAPLPKPPRGRTIVLGAGKASSAMATALEAAFAEARWPSPVSGVVVTRYGYATPTAGITIREAAHPTPDAAGVAATEEILARAAEAGADDLVVFLISGGASALLAAPRQGVSLAEKQRIFSGLLASGAPIGDLNAVRPALSRVKGGGLARAAGGAGAAITYAISDVPGDDPAVIGSGPTVAPLIGRETPADILDRLGVAPPEVGLRTVDATPPPRGWPEYRLIAAPQQALEAAAAVARAAGVAPLILSDRIEGESREVAKALAAIAAQVAAHGQPGAAPLVLLSGGETTVTLRGSGRGGPNTEFALALARALAPTPAATRCFALAVDTDGVDGAAEAGARIRPDTLERAAALGLDAAAFLAANDAFAFFEALGDVVRTGPTLTNVNDFRALLIA